MPDNTVELPTQTGTCVHILNSGNDRVCYIRAVFFFKVIMFCRVHSEPYPGYVSGCYLNPELQ